MPRRVVQALRELLLLLAVCEINLVAQKGPAGRTAASCQQHDALQELQQEANSNTEPRPLVATGGQAPLGSTQPSAIDVAPASLNLDTIPAPHHHKRDRLPMSDEDDDSE